MCASLKNKKSRYAKDRNYKNDNLAETKFMSHWDMEIRGNKIITSQTFTTTDKTSDTIKKVIVYEFLSKSVNDDDHGEQSIQIRVYDLGGHNEYTLINTICLTEKSLILLLFRSSNYFSHEDSFYQTIGC